MASKKEQTTQTAVAVATKEATDSDSSAAETAQETPNAAGEEKTAEVQEGHPLLEDVAVLAIRHRVAAFEQAALMRMMGWADGKMIADADYRAALAKLHGRRLGGGRMV